MRRAMPIRDAILGAQRHDHRLRPCDALAHRRHRSNAHRSSACGGNEDLLLLLCAASFIESGTDLYTSNLTAYFDGDPEVSAWLNDEWEPEELQHGRALKAYINHVWPEFDWDTSFRNFFEEYSTTCSVEEFEKTRALEMVARCVVETGTATLYRAINECSDEPVLKEITDHIRSDEVRHYKHFFKYFKKYNVIEEIGRASCRE